RPGARLRASRAARTAARRRKRSTPGMHRACPASRHDEPASGSRTRSRPASIARHRQHPGAAPPAQRVPDTTRITQRRTDLVTWSAWLRLNPPRSTSARDQTRTAWRRASTDRNLFLLVLGLSEALYLTRAA